MSEFSAKENQVKQLAKTIEKEKELTENALKSRRITARYHPPDKNQESYSRY